MNNLQLFTAVYTEIHDGLSRKDKDSILEFVKSATDEQLHFLLATGHMVESPDEYAQHLKMQKSKTIIEALLDDNFDDTEMDYVPSSGGGVVYKGPEDNGAENLDGKGGLIAQEEKDCVKEDSIAVATVTQVGQAMDKGLMMGGGAGLAAGVVAAAIIVGSYKIYKDYLSKAARACSKHKGLKKKECIATYKKGATQKRIGYLTSRGIKCGKSKNPDKCKAKVHKELAKLKKKLGK